MRDIFTAVTLGWAAGAVWWFSVAQPRRKTYEDFYRNYDAKAVAASTKASFEEGKDGLPSLIVTVCKGMVLGVRSPTSV